MSLKNLIKLFFNLSNLTLTSQQTLLPYCTVLLWLDLYRNQVISIKNAN
jgi:hypothetical protein